MSAGTMTRTRLRRAVPMLRILTPLAAFALLWSLFDTAAILEHLRQADPLWIVGALCAAHGQIVLSALRWRLTAQHLDERFSPGWATREYYVAQLVNQTLPGGVIGDAARAVRARGQTGLIGSGQAVVIERLAGQIALFVVTAAGLAVAVVVPGGLRLPEISLPRPATIALLVAAFVLFGFGIAALLRYAAPRLAAGFGRAIGRSLLARGVWPRQAALSFAIVGCNLATFICAARATGTPLSAEAAVTIVPLILTAMLIPFSIAGWGLREGAAGVLFPLVGATSEAGIAASIAFGAVILVASLPGLLWLTGHRRPDG